jgi:hypothetical protein
VPVSSPSYFPPNRANGDIVGITAGPTTGIRNFLGGQAAGAFTQINDLIVIGHNAFSGGTQVAPQTDVNGASTVVIGSQSAGAATIFTKNDATGALDGPLLIVGSNSYKVAPNGCSTVIIGAGILPAFAPASNIAVGGNTIIGANALKNPTGCSASFIRNVIIGFNAFQSAAGNQDLGGNVVIGSDACLNGATGGVGNFANNVVIGFQAAQSVTNAQRNVLIGMQSGQGLANGTNNICVGQSSTLGGGSSDNILIGQGVSATVNAAGNIFIGNAVGGTQGNRNVRIGQGAGATEGAAVTSTFLVETTDGALVYGDFLTGRVILGNSTPGTNRDFGGGTNTLKLLNGTAGGGNPTGGGYFVVSAGALHWVGSAGTNTTIAPA